MGDVRLLGDVRLWVVCVDCWSVKKEGAKPKLTKRRFLVSAENLKQAQAVAVEHAEKTAAFGPLWVGFEWRESVQTHLPYELT